MQEIQKNLDYRELFDALEGGYIVLLPDTRIVTANLPFYKATNTKLEDIVGKPLFEAFPNDPNAGNDEVIELINQAFNIVREEKISVTMSAYKYNILRPKHMGGGYEVRYWSPTFIPIIKNDEVVFIVEHVLDVTQKFYDDKDLNAKVLENRFLQSAMVGRELKMIELKRENTELRNRLNEQ